MKRFGKLGLLILLVLSASGSYLRMQMTSRYVLEECLSIGSLDDDLIYQWVGIATDNQGAVYLTDALDCSLKKFDSQGTLLVRSGRRGQGPGEFLAPRLVEKFGNRIYVTDQYIPGIHVFGKDLVFSHRIPVLFPVVSFKVLEKNRIAAVILKMGGSRNILILNENGGVEEEIVYTDDGNSLMMNMIDFEIDEKGNFYIVYIFQDRIEKMSPQGVKLWSKSILHNRKVKKKKVASFVLPTEVVFKDIALDSMGRIYILGGHFSKNRSRDIYVLDGSGEIVSLMTLPDSSHCIHIDDRDFLYARANDGVSLKKYSMRYEK
ncbi:hypothetical protein ACFLT9_08725 [Acidobacteriota bacterium]